MTAFPSFPSEAFACALRRHLGVFALLVAPAFAASAADTPTMTVTLLGTGSPALSPDRFSVATLVEAGSQKLLFDAGRGASIRLWQAKVPLGRLDAVFLTHFHSDHTAGLPDIWLTGWIARPYGNRRTPLKVIGPAGTKTLTDHLALAYADDVRIRIADENLPPAGARFDAREFAADGVVYEADGVRVRAFAVDHGALIHPAVGYRVDYAGRSVLLSGDTRFDERLICNAEGVDLLIHEVASSADSLRELPNVKAILNHHVTPEQAGTVFSRSRPRLAVYSHIVLLGDETTAPPTTAQVVEQTRRSYDGPLAVGEDLMRFVIGDKITQQRFDRASGAFE